MFWTTGDRDTAEALQRFVVGGRLTWPTTRLRGLLHRMLGVPGGVTLTLDGLELGRRMIPWAWIDQWGRHDWMLIRTFRITWIGLTPEGAHEAFGRLNMGDRRMTIPNLRRFDHFAELLRAIQMRQQDAPTRLHEPTDVDPPGGYLPPRPWRPGREAVLYYVDGRTGGVHVVAADAVPQRHASILKGTRWHSRRLPRVARETPPGGKLVASTP